jgi:hypothetical protein
MLFPAAAVAITTFLAVLVVAGTYATVRAISQEGGS